MSEAIALNTAYHFEEPTARSQRLPPRGQLRVIAADVRQDRGGAFNATLFFSSLLHAPFYHELILAHYCLPAPGKHGPFNIDELSPADYRPFEPADLAERFEHHLNYRRFGAQPIERSKRERVQHFVASLSARPIDVFELAPCNTFSAGRVAQPHEWSHALLEFHEYVVLDKAQQRFFGVMFAFD